MIKEKRFDLIRAEVAKKKTVEVDELAIALDASKATVRRDLDEMATLGLLRRTHGGAAQLSASIELPFHMKMDLHAPEKRLIGLKTCSLIPDGSVLACTGGTTVMSVVKAMKGKKATVVTNAINVAQEMISYESMHVVVTGGVLQPQSYELVGHIAERCIGDFLFDIALIGVDGISKEWGISTYSIAEASIVRSYAEHSRQVWVVADHSKFGATAPALIAPLDKIHRIVTDRGIDPALVHEMETLGIEVVLADM